MPLPKKYEREKQMSRCRKVRFPQSVVKTCRTLRVSSEGGDWSPERVEAVVVEVELAEAVVAEPEVAEAAVAVARRRGSSSVNRASKARINPGTAMITKVARQP